MQNLARVDLHLLVLFEALMAERNITRAAARIGMAQPSASKGLDRLRHLFADPLFLRSAGGMRPTPRASALAPEIATILASVRALVNERVAFDPATAEGTLRVAMSDAAEFVILPPLLALMAREAPRLTLRAKPLDKNRAFADLDDDRLDAVIGVFGEAPKRLSAATLFEERFVCIARADHPELANGLTIDTYTTLPHLLVTLRDDDRGAVDEALERIGRRRHVLATLARFLAVPAILQQTDAIATVPSRFAREAMGCRVHEPPLAVTAWTERLLWRSGAERDPMVAWFLDAIRRAAREA